MMITVANDTTTTTDESPVHDVNSNIMSKSHWKNRVGHAILLSSNFFTELIAKYEILLDTLIKPTDVGSTQAL